MGVRGTAASWPRRRRGGGRGARSGWRGKGRRGPARGEWVQEVAGVPHWAVGEAGGGLRPSSGAGSAAQRRRAEKQRGREEEEGGWTGFANSEKFKGPTVKLK